MSKWAGKYVIGLTGNIGTGKSVVRRMLEHLGAFGIDADALSHRAIGKGAPGYARVVETFGRWIVGPDGEIDRVKLARVVFSDPDALAQLEAIIHPLVLQAVDWMIKRSKKPIVVVEAIKLLEASMHKDCDSVWVVATAPDVQLSRLMGKRGMRESEARQRIAAQPVQEQKIAAANVVIHNDKMMVDIWKQVAASWQKTVPAKLAAAAQEDAAPTQDVSAQEAAPQGAAALTSSAANAAVPSAVEAPLRVVRGRPRDAEAIAGLINRMKKDSRVTAEDVMGLFGDKAFLLVHAGNALVGCAGWQVENLVARISEIILDPVVAVSQALPVLVEEMERASKDLQCEAALIITAPDLSSDDVWHGLGYERRSPQSLGVAIWQEAARETLQPGLTLYFKQLRKDRVLRPI